MPQRRRLIVHIGQHKTGSTYLQKRFVEDRDRLKEAGTLYPEDFLEIYGHHQIASLFRWGLDDEGAQRLADTLARYGQDWPTVVLSTENLCFLSREAAAALARSFEGWDVEIVYYLRRLTGFWPSHWQELIKHGSDITFERYMLETLKVERDESEFPDQAKQLHRFTEVFGAENMSIFCYDNILARGGDVYETFLRHLLHIPAGENTGRKSVNSSFPPERVEMIRSLNMVMAERTGTRQDLKLRQAYMRTHKQIEAEKDFARFAAAFRERASLYLLGTSNEAVAAREAVLLAEFGHRIIDKASADTLFLPSKPVEVSYATRNWLYEAGQTDYVKRVLEQITQ